MAQGRATIKNIFARHGMPASLIRVGSPDIVVVCTTMQRYAEEKPVEHEISQQDTRFTLRWEELNATVFPLPPRKGDRLLKDGMYYTIKVVRPLETHGEIIGYEVRTIGAT